MEELYRDTAGTLLELSTAVEKAMSWASTAKDKRSLQQLVVLDNLQQMLGALWSLKQSSGDVCTDNVSLVAKALRLVDDVEVFMSSGVDIENAFQSMPELPMHVETLDASLKAPEAFLKVCVTDVRAAAQAMLQKWSNGLGKAAQDSVSKTRSES